MKKNQVSFSKPSKYLSMKTFKWKKITKMIDNQTKYDYFSD